MLKNKSTIKKFSTEIRNAEQSGGEVGLNWYKEDLSAMVDAAVFNFGINNEAYLLDAAMKQGLIDPDRAENIGIARFSSICGLMQNKNYCEAPFVNEWIAFVSEKMPDVSRQILFERLNCSYYERFSIENTIQWLRGGVDVATASNNPLAKFNEIGDGCTRLTDVTPLGIIFANLDDRAISQLIQSATLKKYDEIIPLAGTSNSENYWHHNKSINIIEYCILFNSNGEKFDCALSLFNSSSKKIKTEMSKCIQFCVDEFLVKPDGIINKDKDIWPKVAALISAGADIAVNSLIKDIKIEGNKTILHHLCTVKSKVEDKFENPNMFWRHIPVAIDMLMSEKSENGNSLYNINAQDDHGNSPLHFAVKSGSMRTIQALLRSGANVNQLNEEKISSLDTARSSARLDVLALLQSWSARETIMAVLKSSILPQQTMRKQQF